MAKKNLRQDEEWRPDRRRAGRKLATEAEAGYDVEETLRRRRGRPPIGSGPAVVSPCASIRNCDKP